MTSIEKRIQLAAKEQAEFLLTCTPVEPSEKVKEWRAFLENRKVDHYGQLPAFAVVQIGRYTTEILKAYPNTKQIYLIGSYANGDYRQRNISKQDLELFKKNGHKTNESDFDFYITPPVKEPTRIDETGEILHFWSRNRLLVYDNTPKTAPKEVATRWDFDKLPQHEIENVKLLHNQKNYRALKDLYQSYGVAPHTDCIPCASNEPVEKWTKWYLQEQRR